MSLPPNSTIDDASGPGAHARSASPTSDPPAPSWWAQRSGENSRGGTSLGLGLVTLYLSFLVLIPLGAVVWKSQSNGWSTFWHQVTTPEAWDALKLTLTISAGVALFNLVMGTIIAWVLVRDDFHGKGAVELFIDLPFALPTIVAGVVLLSLYGPRSPAHVNIAFTRTAITVALLFVTLPFVVRTVQPVLI
ncbi:MAG TPA: hypothetical protein VN683_10830, partial [Acidothermaceae bacterium]|nr:hypothetical protein [Acidothermaceae bacterium]